MPRKARKRSLSNIYHVVLKGNGKQVLFEQEADFLNFTRIMRYCKNKWNCRFYAYCMMNNHIHILVDSGGVAVGRIVHDMAQLYAKFYNEKYLHVGHVFQNRFFSDPVEDARQFWEVFSYILYNPEKAGIAAMSDYRWSSFHELFREESLSDWANVVQFAGDKRKVLENVERCNSSRSSELMVYRQIRFSDETVQKWINEDYALDSSAQLKTMDKEERDWILRDLRERGGSIRQIARVTGIGAGIVQRARKT